MKESCGIPGIARAPGAPERHVDDFPRRADATLLAVAPAQGTRPPHLAGIVTTGAGCGGTPSVSENVSMRNVRVRFVC